MSCDSIPIIKIGLIADPQYCNCDPEGVRYYRETLNKLPDAIDTLNQYSVDFVMNLGDMIDRYEDSYDSILPFYHKLSMPYYNLLGNHDFSDVSETYMDSILKRHEMQHYYYDFSIRNWRFLVLDGTELAEYSRHLHPELASEGDSLWQQVQGKVNAHPWNGGISRNQQSWMRTKLQEALDVEQNVIVFCHFPVYPDSMEQGLWNDSSIVGLLEGYPNIVAYISGHEHKGDYGYKNGIHYYTQKAMVDYPDKNSFSVLEIFSNEIRIKGFGNVRDTVLTYTDSKKKPLIFNLSDSVLHYSDHTNSYIGRFFPDITQDFSLISYSLDAPGYENNYFTIRGDSLFLYTGSDISAIPDIRIEVVATGCEFDTTSRIFHIVFDTASAYFHYPLPDTLLEVSNPYIVLLDSFVTDYSRFGLGYSLVSTDSSVISTILTDTSFIFTPEQAGNSFIELICNDPYLDKTYIHRFSIIVYDPDNSPPFPNDSSDLNFFVLLYDSLGVDLNSLFNDPDDDDLEFGFILGDTGAFSGNIMDSILWIYALSTGQTFCEIIADDNRGGTSALILDLVVNQNPVRIGDISEFVFPYLGTCITIDPDTLYSDPDGDTLHYRIYESYFPATITDESILEICPENEGDGIMVLEITDNRNGMLTDSLTFRFETQATSVNSFNRTSYSYDCNLFPNPSKGIIFIQFDSAHTGYIEMVLTDPSGRVLQKRFVKSESIGQSQVEFSIQENIGNGLYLFGVFLAESKFEVYRVILLR